MGNNLRKLRNARGWNQATAALALGTKINNYGKLERGERSLHTKWINRAAAAYGVDPGEVVGKSASEITLVGRVVFLGIDGVTFFVIPRTSSVGIELRQGKGPSGNAPEFELGIRLTLEEARQFARLLVATADEAEASSKTR